MPLVREFLLAPISPRNPFLRNQGPRKDSRPGEFNPRMFTQEPSTLVGGFVPSVIRVLPGQGRGLFCLPTEMTYTRLSPCNGRDHDDPASLRFQERRGIGERGFFADFSAQGADQDITIRHGEGVQGFFDRRESQRLTERDARERVGVAGVAN